MTIAAGSRLGPYDVLGLLGAGGMGEVYRARDPKLRREIALKVLPDSFSADTERLARFEREAQLLASLNHPNVGVIHGFEESHGTRYLVLELVPGETLAERLASGPLQIEEALGVGRQIAEALESAHERGVVHRDLKPANVKITPEGQVKVLDFGLAKAFGVDSSSGELSHSPTITSGATREGVILGTAAYMSPEQARGKTVDKRTDIWAFGCVLYESLTGNRAFPGETVSDTLAAVLRADVDWAALPAATPASVRSLIARCLERDPRNRLHDIADARIELEEAIRRERGAMSAPGALVAPAGDRKPRLWLAVAAAALAAALGGYALGRLFARSGPLPASGLSLHALVPVPAGHRLAGWASPVVALSRDGRKLAFVSESDQNVQELWIHHLDRGEVRKVPGSENAEGPFFSPDGQWVAFAVEVSGRSARPGELKKYSLATGLTQSICGIKDYFGGDWGEDGTILFSELPTQGIQRVAASGGKQQPVVSKVRLGGTEVSRALAMPQRLPGGTTLLVMDWDASTFGDAAVLDLGTKTLTHLHLSPLAARYLPSGHLLFMQPDATLMAAPFDPRAGKLSGEAVAVAKDVSIANRAGVFAVSDTGTFVSASGFLRGSGREPMKLVRALSGGVISDLPFEAHPYGRYPRISPDGLRIAVTDWDGDLWLLDRVRGSRLRLPRGAVVGRDWLVWSRDGREIVFTGGEDGKPSWGIYRQSSDGSAGPATLLEGEGLEKHPYSFTLDGSALLFAASDALMLLPFEKKAAPRPILDDRQADLPALSPDGRWLAYESEGGSGTIEVFVQPYPGSAGRMQVSVGGGARPVWTRDGKRLFFRKSDQILFVSMGGTAHAPEHSSPALFAELPGMRGFDVTPDGREVIAIVRPPGTGIIRHLTIVTNWFQELDRLVPRPGIGR